MADGGMIPSSTRPANFRFGNTDQDRLLSRLISHPLRSIQDDSQGSQQQQQPPGGNHYRAHSNKQATVEHKFEPLPVLKRYQKYNDPAEIQARNRQQLIDANKLRVSSPESPVEKRAKLSLPPINNRTSDSDKRSDAASDNGSTRSNKRKQLDTRDLLLGEGDMHRVIEYIRRAPDGFFLYLTHTYSRNDTRHNYYNLRVVSYEQCGHEYFTISNAGISYYRPGEEVEFTPLETFAKEYERYVRLIQIKVFSTFRIWKAFMVWYKNIRVKKVTQASKALTNNLFLLQDALRPALLNIREMCFRISDMSLCKIEKKHTYTLHEFTENQNQTLTQVSARLQEFRDLVKDVVASACRTRLFEAGFVPDDFLHATDSSNDHMNGGNLTMPDSMDIDTLAQPPDKATYAEQANKRTHCRRLTNFIRLCDYLIVNTFHVLAVNSVQSLKNHFLEQLEATPNKDEIIGYVEEIRRKVDKSTAIENSEEPPTTTTTATEMDTKSNAKPVSGPPPPGPPGIRPPGEEGEVAKRHIPLFITEMKLFMEGILYQPDGINFQSGINHVIRSFQETLLAINNLIPDTTFDNFTRPYINEKYEDKTCGDGPDLRNMFTADYHFQDLIKDCSDSLEAGFNAAKIYSDTFKEFHRFYVENENTDVDALRSDPHDVEFFAEALARYTREEKMAQLIDVKKPLGLLMIDATDSKAKLEPSPRRILDVINDILPKIAKSKTDALKSEAQDATVKLETKPESTMDFVDALTFLDEIQERIDPLEQEAEVVRQMYELIDQYQVPCPPEDVVSYGSLTTTLNGCRNAMDKALTERDAYVLKFVALLDKDIELLTHEVRQIKQDSQNPLLLDPSADKDKVKLLLDDYLKKIDQQQRRSAEYRLYQKNFKVEVTKFDELEEVYGELKLKEMLWNSLNEWDVMLEEEKVRDFNKLDHEQLTANVNKYGKNVYQLERGLPPNHLVPILKEKVETLRAKLPTITNLRNPNFRRRHWDEIEELIKFHPTAEDPLTLGKLMEINAFQHEERIQEISGQASSEASLEGILKRVEDSWKAVEFPVISYKDYKDVYILGGTDDIIQLLDDANINIATIASSRHVGPIRPRVEDWQANLDLFGKTLDAWSKCQKTWQYLESIFGAPDIQRQLPAEAKMFNQVDKSFKDVMRKTNKIPLAIKAGTQPGYLELFQTNNALLEQVQHALASYLETKRSNFPRFYFLSDEELLEILSQTRNPLAVQPHLRKCFEGIYRLEFLSKGGEDMELTMTMAPEIRAMFSPEGERVEVLKVKATGNVEDWLKQVEKNMITAVRACIKKAKDDFEKSVRENWLVRHPHQSVLTVSQTYWCLALTAILMSDETVRQQKLEEFEKMSYQNLNKLAALVRQELPQLVRDVCRALITIDVHARDIVSELVQIKNPSITSFEWLKQLRYYFEQDLTVIRMANAQYIYGYEYLGASDRLVITPLTDRCYLCLMGALQLDLGGAPAGPAGTGKTETTKDLAKALAKQCVVFNCSDQVDYKMMGRFFSGLAQSGAWACFDEFNRINIEVLSVIAQQLITIRDAKATKLSTFMFEGREIRLVPTCAVFITMNPGYAGRTELPDNLKALFRPQSMMVPDYRLIAEVILYSEGFENSKVLARKMVQMYKLCSEQLSQQDHYDFGMRAVKSVLVMAGVLKRESPNIDEDLVLIRALRDSNLPKFLTDDAILFKAIIQDLFPNVLLPEHDYGQLRRTIIDVQVRRDLQTDESQIRKVIQFYETMVIRHGVMLVGPTLGGKTTVYRILADALTDLHANGVPYHFYQPVHTYVLNPKSITAGELYGEFNRTTMEWKDGLMGSSVRQCVLDQSKDHHWIICDGPVDAVWIENLNTVLDDNKMLCLANSERIKYTPFMHMVFEVQDLASASPATVSRCGMVYIDSNDIRWGPYVKTWSRTFEAKFGPLYTEYLLNLFNTYVDKGLMFVRKACKEVIKQVDIAKAITLCCLIDSLLTTDEKVDLKLEEAKMKIMIATTFAFCYVWSVGGNIVAKDWDQFDTFVRQQFEEDADAKLGQGGDLFSYEIDVHHRRMDTWEKSVPTFKYDKTKPFFDLLVPNIDSCRFGYLLEKLVSVNKSVLFTGETGVGKTVIARAQLLKLADEQNILPLFLNFSAQTSSKRTQEMIVPKLEKRKKNALGPPKGKRMVILIDDLNMPKLETYGAQPPIELLRQYQDFGGLYDRETLKWVEIQDVILCAACGPPGGGRNPTTARLLRHFAIFAIPAPSEYSLKHIFKSILNGYLADFNQNVKGAGDGIVDAAVEIYLRMSAELLPTPTKSHYVFNLRDLSKCVQGVLQVKPESVADRDGLVRVFFHESMRVFHDRLINDEDKHYFHSMLSELASRLFTMQIDATSFTQKPIIFGDFMKVGAPKTERLYEEITDMTKIRNVLQDYQEDYNLTNNKNTRLVFFMDAIEHIARIARIIRQDRGNALLVGVGGTGKQSLTRLASHICGYKCFQIELSRGYNYDSFHEDLKKLYEQAGPNNENTVFLFTDNQIVVEEFLEDINNILNSGEVPNLFDKQDEYERMIIGCRPGAKEAGIPENDRDAIYTFFINRVRNNLHLVLCMSPVGSSFRTRCRMFPSLVNCCTLDWFSEWPREALLSVAHTFYEKYPWAQGEEFMVQALAKMSVEIHMSVTLKAKQLLSELRRYYYTTPTSYLELINLYLMMLNDKKKEIDNARARVERGLKKLEETNVLVDEMQVELVALEPQLKKKSDETAKLMETLAVDQEKADEVRRVVMEDEAVARVKAEETQVMKDDAQRDLNQALPAVEKANEAIGRLKKDSIGEVRTFTKPPHMVEVVMQAVCIMFEKKKDWPSAKLLLGDADLLNQIRNYPKDNIPESILRDLKPYLQMPNFNYKDILQSSVACASLAEWVIAMDMYAKIAREVAPKRKRVAAAEADLRSVNDQLKKKQQQLNQVEVKIKELQDSYDHQVAEKKKLEISIMQTQSRLKRASKLTTALADEQIRWKESIHLFREQMKTVTGNVFVSSACVAYYGAFPSAYRHELVEHWVTGCKEHSIPVSDNPSIINVLADPFSIRQWVTQGLPRDDFSTENAILVTKGRRWPLIIDPQEQANRWIKNKEKDNALKVIKMTDGHFLRILENCVRIGMPLLLEDVGETLDPALEPILLKQTFMSGGRLLIRLGDSDIEYDNNFKFYMTTKLSNPHYLPEICIKVTIINFSVTKQGLEDQILSDVVRLERPDLDEEMNRLIITMNNDRNQLKAIEDKILKMLFESEGNILDNEELVNSLNDSKVTSSAIKRRLEETIKTEANISAAREKYRRVATRGSLLYFVVADLGLIDPMYQFSLRYFTQLFNATIEQSTKSDNLDQRLVIILDSTTEIMYTNVSRGLFEKDKLVFSFLLCAEILKLEGLINEIEWNFLLRGGLITEQKRPSKPAHDWLTIEHWNQALALSEVSQTFKNLPQDIEQYQQPLYVQINPELRVVINSSDMTAKMSSDYDTNLSDFQKLLFVKAFSPYLLVQSITHFVAKQLGKKFVESPSVELPVLYQDMSNRTALVFILSTGSDPMSSFSRFATEMNMANSYKAISLGQGQGPIAEDMISKSVSAGDWVFLQNCHLAASWMVNMEAIVKNINEGITPCHPNFRLFLSSMPAKTFPVSVLQNSVKVTSEPPKGIRANMKRAFIDLTATFFETHRLEMDWKKMVFGICFFHAILLERKKFGPLGFNIRYEFNDSDRECALSNFEMFCKDGAVPWDALIYITGEITYGGRVTDFWDQRCLRTILKRFFSPQTLEPGYKYSSSGIYHCPEQQFLQQYRDYIEELPINDNPEIFGMNSNANITFQTQESNYLVNTIIDIQPRVSSSGAGKSNDDIVYELAEAILSKLPEKLEIDKAPKYLFEPDAKDRLNSLTTVLQQEVDRYNRLLTIIKLSLMNQMKAIKGLVVMDDALEKMYNAFLNNQVPSIWADAAYPSLKSLASWIKDLLLRCDFIGLWILQGLPKSYWLPGFFFPQGFLTGVLQVHARKYDLPIDELSFHFTILNHERDHESYNEQAKRLEYGKKLEVDEQLVKVKDGVLLHGLFMEAFRWDAERGQITDAIRGEMIATLPMLHMEPRQNYVVDPTHYISPLYKTAARAGVLSTTGHSTNFVVTVNLPTDKSPDYWISMGSALLCQMSD